MSSTPVSIVGITTSVRDSGGKPCEKSIRGNARGVTSKVVTQFTIPKANWLVASSRRTASIASTASGTPSSRAFAKSAAVSAAVTAAIEPRYSSNGTRRPILWIASAGDGRILAARSSRGRPLSTR